jgi:hypothetical protein
MPAHGIGGETRVYKKRVFIEQDDEDARDWEEKTAEEEICAQTVRNAKNSRGKGYK